MKIKVMVSTGILCAVLGAVISLSNEDAPVGSVARFKKLVPVRKIQKPLPVLVPGLQIPMQDIQVDSNHEEAKEVEVNRMREELNLDLREIHQRRLVEALNDPRANPAVKEEALRFMTEYLRKLASYMKIRNQQVQAMMEKQNG